jgi:hypothetical protein
MTAHFDVWLRMNPFYPDEHEEDNLTPMAEMDDEEAMALATKSVGYVAGPKQAGGRWIKDSFRYPRPDIQGRTLQHYKKGTS